MFFTYAPQKVQQQQQVEHYNLIADAMVRKGILAILNAKMAREFPQRSNAFHGGKVELLKELMQDVNNMFDAIAEGFEIDRKPSSSMEGMVLECDTLAEQAKNEDSPPSILEVLHKEVQAEMSNVSEAALEREDGPVGTAYWKGAQAAYDVVLKKILALAPEAFFLDKYVPAYSVAKFPLSEELSAADLLSIDTTDDRNFVLVNIPPELLSNGSVSNVKHKLFISDGYISELSVESLREAVGALEKCTNVKLVVSFPDKDTASITEAGITSLHADFFKGASNISVELGLPPSDVKKKTEVKITLSRGVERDEQTEAYLVYDSLSGNFKGLRVDSVFLEPAKNIVNYLSGKYDVLLSENRFSVMYALKQAISKQLYACTWNNFILMSLDEVSKLENIVVKMY